MRACTLWGWMDKQFPPPGEDPRAAGFVKMTVLKKCQLLFGRNRV